MSLMPIVVALSGLSGALALVLAVVYARNMRQVPSPFTRALLVFALFLVVQSAITVYHDLTMMATFTGQAQELLVVEGVLEVIALGALSWATMR
jgi:hypothetical protein